MSGEIWALLSAAAWAVDSILVRKGTAFSNASTAAFVSFLVSVLFLVPVHLLRSFPAEKIFHSANLYFVASGVIQPAMVRVLFYMGIIRLGVSRAGPLRGTAPLFTLALAFFVLSEAAWALRLCRRGSDRAGNLAGILPPGRRSQLAHRRSSVPTGSSATRFSVAEHPQVGLAGYGRAVDRFDGQQRDVRFYACSSRSGFRGHSDHSSFAAVACHTTA